MNLSMLITRLNGILSATLNEFGIPTDKVLGAISDSVAVNIKAMESMGIIRIPNEKLINSEVFGSNDTN